MSTKAQDTTPGQNDAKTLLCDGLNQSALIIFQNNKAKGFWDNERNVGELLMLVTSELGEALEAHRKGRFADWSNVKDDGYGFASLIKDTFEDEIADAVIRLLDLSAGLGIDLERHINAKVRYNASRPKLHGKLY
jgi:NTP pyrophosphatase (non-canonical NTP hydrolase)